MQLHDETFIAGFITGQETLVTFNYHARRQVRAESLNPP
jgi:hypothetical protein